MTIVAVIHTPRSPLSAVFLVYAQLAEYLRRRGHSLTIVTPEDLPALNRLHGRWLPLVYPLAVDRWLRRRSADLVLFHSHAGWRATLRGNRPYAAFTVFHGLEPIHYEVLADEMRRAGRPLRLPFRVLHGWLVPRLLRASCRRSDRVLCLNSTEATYLQAQGWATPESVAAFAHGVAPEFYADRSFDRDPSTLCFVGQWIERKGIRYLSEAFSALGRRHPTLRLCCVGTLADADRVRDSFPPDVRPRVDVHPRVDRAELARLYERADLFVFPTLFEGFSLALIEAMASGLPIVTTPVGAAPDLLESEVSALLVPPRDAGAVGRAVSRLVTNPALASRLGGAAQRIARQYTLDAVHARLLGLFEASAPAATGAVARPPTS